jgi:hypothetical protein
MKELNFLHIELLKKDIQRYQRISHIHFKITKVEPNENTQRSQLKIKKKTYSENPRNIFRKTIFITLGIIFEFVIVVIMARYTVGFMICYISQIFVFLIKFLKSDIYSEFLLPFSLNQTLYLVYVFQLISFINKSKIDFYQLVGITTDSHHERR